MQLKKKKFCVLVCVRLLSVTLENIIRIFSDRSQRTFQSFPQRAYLSKNFNQSQNLKIPNSH